MTQNRNALEAAPSAEVVAVSILYGILLVIIITTQYDDMATNASSDGVEIVPEQSEEPSPRDPQRRRQPSLLDGLLQPPAQNATDTGFGILCNDPSGLCLSATGNFLKDTSTGSKQQQQQSIQNVDDTVNSGVYTSLTKLAHQLHPGPTDASTAPLITIEYEESNLLIKEYGGHAIALKVPALRKDSSSDDTTGAGEGGGGTATSSSLENTAATDNGGSS